MKIINRNNTIGTLCLFLLAAVLPVSCLKDDYAAKEKATLTLYFTTTSNSNGTSSDGTTIGPELPNEHMRTLRVIVVDKLGKIRYNTKVNVPEDQTQTVINFSELIVDSEGETKFDVYAIANEEVYVTNNEWEGTNINLNDLKGKILDNAILSKLNEGTAKDKYEEGYAVPQTAIQEVTVTPGQDNKATIPLEFVVAKVCLTIENTSTDLQTVSGISLSEVNTTSTKLLGETSVTSTDTGKALSLGTMTDIPAETNGTPGKSTVYAYFYENTGGDYKLNATWGTPSNKEFNIKTLGSLFEIKRGTELNIVITIKKNITIPEDFFIQVNTWDSADMEIPSFQ